MPLALSPAFVRAFNFVVSPKVEGGLSMDRNDRGNWTSGEVGKGELKGSNMGISAMRYPHLDIAALKSSDVAQIYYRDYWLAFKCDQLPARLALVYFDALVNMKPEDVALCLQAALDVKQDGDVGPQTLAAARAQEQNDSCANFLAERALRYATFKKFPDYGRGWFRRCMRAAMEVGK